MKTKNNVQKTILRSAAVVVSFVLISLTVSAQDFWKRLIENSSFNDIAMAMVAAPSETKLISAPGKNLEATYFENELESELELESWMTDYTRFNVEFRYEEEIETEFNIEDWMMDANVFQSEKELESSLELEAWMMSEKVWSI